MKSGLPTQYTKTDLDNARTKGQIVGWVQGGAVAVSGMILLGFVGWIPTLAVFGVGGYVLYKVFARSKRRSDDGAA